MCLGVASEKALPGEVWLSSQNRNFENRMGTGSLAHLASAATVAASAPSMRLKDPRPILDRLDRARYAKLLGRLDPSRVPAIHTVEPEPALSAATAAKGPGAAAKGAAVRGLVQRFGDNVDTDAMIPGEFCHLTSLADLGRHCFHHVRPAFHDRAQAGATIVVAGEGWGSGSSREQAVWALKGAGVKAVVARSFAFIHKRNLVNEALPFLVVRDPEFDALAAEGEELEVDLAHSRVTHLKTGRSFSGAPPSAVISALRREGGLVLAIKQRGPKVFEALAAG